MLSIRLTSVFHTTPILSHARPARSPFCSREGADEMEELQGIQAGERERVVRAVICIRSEQTDWRFFSWPSDRWRSARCCWPAGGPRYFISQQRQGWNKNQMFSLPQSFSSSSLNAESSTTSISLRQPQTFSIIKTKRLGSSLT